MTRGTLLGGEAPLAEREALMLSPLRLAYLGDAVHHLLVRTGLLVGGGNAGAMHRVAVSQVNAAAQSRALSRIAGLLDETETDVVRRGRNAHARHGTPRRANAADYKQATGLEALFGYLYLTGRTERLIMLFRIMQEETTCLDRN